jgi:hypothetical protein
MRWGGIVAGALGGAADAVGQIADTNIKLREVEAAEKRKALLDREQFEYEAEAKLRYAPRVAQAEGEAAAIKDRVMQEAKNERRDNITGGLIAKELDGSVIGDESTWTADQEAVLARGMQAREAELRNDPKIRQEVGLRMGEITEKDIMTDDRNRDIAQLRAEVVNAKTEMERQRAQDRLDNALAVAGIRAAGGGSSGSGNREILSFLDNQRKSIDSELRDIKDAQRVELEKEYNQQNRQRIIAEYNDRRKALEAKRQQIDADFAEVRRRLDMPPAVGEKPKGGDNPKSGSTAAPYKEGTKLRGPDGKTYVVRNGQPVLEK